MMREQEINRRAIAEWIKDGRFSGRFIVPGKKPICHLPDQLADEMLLSVTSIEKTNNILILYTAELLPTLATRGFANVTITTKVHDPFIAGIVKACNHYFNTNYKYMTIGEIEEKNMKFDVVFANPPYSGKGNPLYLQFLHKAMDITSSKVVFLTPAIYLLDQKKENPFYRDIRDRLKGRLESVIIHPHDVFGTQNAAINTAVATVTVDMENQHDEFQVSYVTTGKSFMLDDIELINQFANYDVFPALRKKILSFAKKLNAHQFESMDGDVFLNVPQLQRYKFFSEAIISERSDDDNFGLYFDDQATAKAAAEYFQTPFAKLALHIYKPNMHIKGGRNLRSVPMFNSAEDYSNYVELLGLSDAEIEFCNHINDNYRDYFFFS